MRRQKLFLFFPWVLTVALMVHLAAPIGYLSGIAKAKKAQWSYIEAHHHTDHFQVLHLSLSQFEKYFDAPEQELELNGRRYDVIGHQRSGNEIICQVLADERETKLARDLDHCMGHPEKTNHPVQFWFPVYFQTVVSHIPISYRLCVLAFQFPVNEYFRARMSEKDVSPPPKVFSSRC